MHQLAMRTTVCFCLASTLTDTLTLKCLCLTDKNKGFDPPPHQVMLILLLKRDK